MHSFTQSWGKELGKFGIRVLGIAPGILDRTPANNDEKYRAQAYGDVYKRQEMILVIYHFYPAKWISSAGLGVMICGFIMFPVLACIRRKKRFH